MRRKSSPTIDWRTRLNRSWRKSVFLAATRAFETRRFRSFGFGTLVAYAIAITVLLANAVFALIGAYLIAFDFPNIPAGILGLLMLTLAFAARPRFPSESAGAPRDTYPVLSKNLDLISDALGAPRIETIELTSDWNAAVWQSSFTKDAHLIVGLPLLHAAPHQTRLAILAHEIGHLVNGDPRRYTLLAAGRHTLTKWLHAFGYDEILPPMSDVAGAGELVRQIFAFLLFGLRAILDRGTFFDSQKAEYLADGFAAEIAGTPATQDALLLTATDFHLDRALQSFIPKGDARGLETLDYLRNEAQLSDDAVLEREQRLEHSLVRTDTSHPPTTYRIGFLNTIEPREPTLAISKDTWKTIENEWAMHAETLGGEVLSRRQTHMTLI